MSRRYPQWKIDLWQRAWDEHLKCLHEQYRIANAARKAAGE